MLVCIYVYTYVPILVWSKARGSRWALQKEKKEEG